MKDKRKGGREGEGKGGVENEANFLIITRLCPCFSRNLLIEIFFLALAIYYYLQNFYPILLTTSWKIYL